MGAAFCACAAGTDFMSDDPPCLIERYDKEREVSMKMIATPVVSFPKNPEDPEAPKTVWVAPPNAAPRLAPFPVWRRTMRIKATHAMR